jgi:hypothetical protein
MDRPPPGDTDAFHDYFLQKLRSWSVAMGMLPIIAYIDDLDQREGCTLSWNDYEAFKEHVEYKKGNAPLHSSLLIIEYCRSDVDDCIVVHAKPETGEPKNHIKPTDLTRKWTSHLHSQLKRAGWVPTIEMAEKATGTTLPQLMAGHASKRIGPKLRLSHKRLTEFELWNGEIYGAMAEYEDLRASRSDGTPSSASFDKFAEALVDSIDRAGDLRSVCEEAQL